MWLFREIICTWYLSIWTWILRKLWIRKRMSLRQSWLKWVDNQGETSKQRYCSTFPIFRVTCIRYWMHSTSVTLIGYCIGILSHRICLLTLQGKLRYSNVTILVWWPPLILPIAASWLWTGPCFQCAHAGLYPRSGHSLVSCPWNTPRYQVLYNECGHLESWLHILRNGKCQYKFRSHL